MNKFLIIIALLTLSSLGHADEVCGRLMSYYKKDGGYAIDYIDNNKDRNSIRVVLSVGDQEFIAIAMSDGQPCSQRQNICEQDFSKSQFEILQALH